MPVLIAILVFVVTICLVWILGFARWIRPTAESDRVLGVDADREEARSVRMKAEQTLQVLSRIRPPRGQSASTLRRTLVYAGWRSESAIVTFQGVRVAAIVLLSGAAALVSYAAAAETANLALSTAAGAFAGYFLPGEICRRIAKARQERIRKSLPNTLDLLTVCVEAGLGLDQAMMHTASELRAAFPDLSEELSLCNIEIRAGKSRADALRRLGERTGVADVTRLGSVIIQADRFGTSIAHSLRTHSEYLRVHARQTAEEKAAKLGVKLVFPIFFFIMPTLFIITVGPVVVTICRDLLPMMESL